MIQKYYYSNSSMFSCSVGRQVSRVQHQKICYLDFCPINITYDAKNKVRMPEATCCYM